MHLRFRPTAVLALACILPFAAGCNHPAPQVLVHHERLRIGSIQGVVAFTGTLPKPSPADLAKAQACAKLQQQNRPSHFLHRRQDHLLPRTLPPVFIWISAGLKNPAPAQLRHQTVLTQLDCRLHPQILGVLPGQPVDFANNDLFPTHFHVASRTPGNPSFNLTLLPQKPGQVRSFPHPELLIPVTSPGLPHSRTQTRAYINVVSNPFFTVSGPEGHFLLPNLPAGVYTLSAIRPGYPVQSQTITIKDKTVTHIIFTFPASNTPPPATAK